MYIEQLPNTMPLPVYYLVAALIIVLLLVAVFAEPLSNMDQLPNYVPR